MTRIGLISRFKITLFFNYMNRSNWFDLGSLNDSCGLTSDINVFGLFSECIDWAYWTPKKKTNCLESI